ncbi:MAG: ABC transporter ATP-binding protein [Bacteriovoracales bacterium]|nr:ABC transporter ATP-binding protein [Bacteriovoracales bacterium]
MILVKNICKKFKQGDAIIWALKDVSFEILEPTTFAIIGRSGSGKTTLLSLLAGLESPDSGDILIEDQNITTLTEKEMGRFRSKNIGIVFQQFHLMPHLSAWENVALPLEILGDKDAEEKAKQYLEKLGLQNRISHFPDQLSGGECQRVAIARASIQRPKVLLADEPTGNLDAKSSKMTMDLLFSLVEENKMSLILVTHDLELANRCALQKTLSKSLSQK